MSRSVRIQHLTDFHYAKSREYDQSVVIRALLKDASTLRDKGEVPDFVIFSGDLVYAGDNRDDYFYFIDNLLFPLSKNLGISPSRFVFVPGNHDVQRKIAEQQENLLTGITTNITNRDIANDIFLKGNFDDISENKFKNFREFLSYIDTPSILNSNAFGIAYTFPELDTDVVALNTAVCSWGGFRGKNDLRQLTVPEASIDALLSTCSSTRVIIAQHHPTSWFTEFCETDFQSLTDSRAAFRFFGHMHELRPQSAARIGGQQTEVQGGALYSGRGRYIGYAIAQDAGQPGHQALEFRTYFDARREFSVGEDRAPGGVFFPNEASARHFRNLQPRIDRQAVLEWARARLSPAARVQLNEALVNRPLNEVFVPPPLVCLPPIPEKNAEDKEERTEVKISFANVAQGKENYIICGKREYGKTSLLRQIAVSLLDGICQSNAQQIPALLNFSDIVPGDQRIERLIRAFFGVELEGAKLADLLDTGIVTILVDDVVLSDKTRFAVLSKFIAIYPKCRYIFTTVESEASRFSSVVTPGLPIAMTTIFVRAMTHRGIRTLVEKWDAQKSLDHEAMMKRIMHEIRSINLPVTAVNGTILLSIYEARNKFRPINRSVLIENFVELLLDKAEQGAERRNFDFKNKVDILAYLTEHMCRTNIYVIRKIEALNVFDKYLIRFGLNQDSSSLLSYFISSRILDQKSDGCIYFRYRSFLEYFIASRMLVDSTFKDWVLSPENYLSYVNEIQYYSGLLRDAADVLELVAGRFAELSERSTAELKWSPDAKRLDTFKLTDPKSEDAASMLAALEDQLAMPPLTDEERDELLDASLPEDVESRQEVYRPKPTDVGSQTLLCLLLYSGVLRNLELVPDTKKRQHLAHVLQGWCLFTMASFMVVPMLAKHRKMLINGVSYEVNVPAHFSDGKVARILYNSLPSAIGDLIFANLGTEKLELQLAQIDLDYSNEPYLAKFFRHALMTDLNVGIWWNHLPDFLKIVEKSPYLTEASLWKMREILLVKNLPPEGAPVFRKSIAEALTRLRGVTGPERARQLSEQIQKLSRQDMLRRLKMQVDERENGQSKD